MSDLRTALTQHSKRVDAAIADFLAKQRSESEAIDRYLARSVDLLTAFTLRGGKDIRSFLSRTAYTLAGGPKHDGLDLALASVELHHKHILILDDISDRDESRYGGPTLEYAYRQVMSGLPDFEHRSQSFAMLDGVLLGSFSKEILLASRFSPEITVRVLHILDTVMFRDTLAGWQIHGMECTQLLKESSQAEFIKGLRLVTASYTFAGPLQIGLLLAKNKNQTLEKALLTYADEVGTAFQMHDDILGLYGDPKRTGKPVGNDVREGKKTLLLQVAYERGSSAEKKILEQACGKPISTDTLKTVQRIVEDTGSLESSKQLEAEYVARGIAALKSLPRSTAKSLLIELAHYIISRDK